MRDSSSHSLTSQRPSSPYRLPPSRAAQALRLTGMHRVISLPMGCLCSITCLSYTGTHPSCLRWCRPRQISPWGPAPLPTPHQPTRPACVVRSPAPHSVDFHHFTMIRNTFVSRALRRDPLRVRVRVARSRYGGATPSGAQGHRRENWVEGEYPSAHRSRASPTKGTRLQRHRVSGWRPEIRDRHTGAPASAP